MYNIIFRRELTLGEYYDKHLTEYDICNKYFNTYTERTSIPNNSIVIGRYSVLPYYSELERDLKNKNCKLINSFAEHEFISKFSWYNECEELQKYTPKTWLEYELPYIKDNGPFVIKGCTNSMKHNWNTHMFAKNRNSIIDVIRNLNQDSLISSQDILIRKYEPLKTFEIGINDLRFTNEWRLFYYKNKLLSYGYYWSNLDDLSKPNITQDAIDLANYCADIISKYTNFFVLDIAEKENGEWMLVEINDGQMSGTSCNDPNILYSNLKKELEYDNWRY